MGRPRAIVLGPVLVAGLIVAVLGLFIILDSERQVSGEAEFVTGMLILILGLVLMGVPMVAIIMSRYNLQERGK